jgi:hypothetical protein
LSWAGNVGSAQTWLADDTPLLPEVFRSFEDKVFHK